MHRAKSYEAAQGFATAGLCRPAFSTFIMGGKVLGELIEQLSNGRELNEHLVCLLHQVEEESADLFTILRLNKTKVRQDVAKNGSRTIQENAEGRIEFTQVV